MMKLDDDYLALTASVAQEVKTDSYRLLELKPGGRHLEVGSGTGYDSIALAERHPDCHITGIDLYKDIVELANERAVGLGLENVQHIDGNAAEHDFQEPFDSMRAERVFQHLEDREIHALVAHLARYTRVGGVFCLVGVDWDTLTATIPPHHRETFLMMKGYLINVSNIHFIHTAIAAFEDSGFELEHTDTYDYWVSDFRASFTIFNLENIADHLALDSDRMQAMRADFVDGKHYFAVGGCTLLFRKR